MTEVRAARGYGLTVLAGSAVLIAAGLAYARFKGIPGPYVVPLLAAFLLEFAFYLLPGFETLRHRLRDRWPVTAFAALLALSAVLPYLVYAFGCGRFSPDSFLRLVILAVFLSFWYVYRRPSPTTDFAVLAVIAAVLLSRFFARVYVSPAPGVRIDVLGQLMLARVAALALFEIREIAPVGYGFLPNANHWRTGAKYFLYFLPVGFPLGLAIGLLHFAPNRKELAFAPLLFLGALWVLALSEEFYFRGLLQQWLTDWTRKPLIALIVTSVVFGLCHITFGVFPNWRLASLATLAGFFYGKAYQEAGDIRAAMVTHALTVTVWRTFF